MDRRVEDWLKTNVYHDIPDIIGFERVGLSHYVETELMIKTNDGELYTPIKELRGWVDMPKYVYDWLF